MGTWGPSPFDNDAAADLLRDLAESNSISELIHEQFLTVINAGAYAYLDVDDGQRCVAACELLARALENREATKPVAPRSNARFAKILYALRGKHAFVKPAMKALLRVLDRKHSELAGLSNSLEPFQDLYERLLAVLEDGATSPQIDVRALLASASEEAAPPRAASLPATQPFSTSPFDIRNMGLTPAISMSIAEQSRAWTLLKNGVMNAYEQLSDDDCEKLDGRNISQVQIARRFKPTDATLRAVDKLLSRNPQAALKETLNGYGALDDRDFLSRLPPNNSGCH